MIAHPGSLTRTDWEMVLEEVSGGRSAVIGPLRPQDEAALSLLASHGISIRLHFGIGNWMGCYHWIPASPLFSGLPCGGLAGEAYVNVRPRYVMSELGGEVLAGSLSNTQTRLEAPAILWYSDIERISLGKGSVVFCQYLIFDTPMADPLADQLLANLITMLQASLKEGEILKARYEEGLRLDLELSQDTRDSQMAARWEVWDLYPLGCVQCPCQSPFSGLASL